MHIFYKEIYFISLLSIIFLILTKNIFSTESTNQAINAALNLKATQSKNETHSNSEEHDEPSHLYFIMHVGPMKTATSTIQCSLMNLESQKLLPKNIILAESNYRDCYRMINIKNTTTVSCFKRWNSTVKGMPNCWTKNYVPYIKKQESHNRSIIISQENLSWLTKIIGTEKDVNRDFLKQLKESLGGRYQIVVIITYRTFFDWVYSYYVQHIKNGSGGNRDFDHWPDEGGYEYYSIRKFVEEMLKAGERQFFVDKLLGFFSFDGILIKVMNLDEGDIVKQFLCDGLPSPLNETTCDLADKVKLEGDLNAAPDSIWANQLAVKAHKNGMIQSKTVTRIKVINDILIYEKEHGSLYDNAPFVCPDEDFFDKILNQTIKISLKVYSDYTNKQKKDKELYYREKWRKKKKNFCALDTTEMFAQEEWKSFFSQYASNSTIS